MYGALLVDVSQQEMKIALGGGGAGEGSKDLVYQHLRKTLYTSTQSQNFYLKTKEEKNI